jgi:TonB family protein
MVLTLILAAMLAQNDAAPATPATLVGNPGMLIQRGDYPEVALLDDIEGVTAFQLTVAPDGNPRQCTVTASSGSVLLDKRACDLILARARFKPAMQGGTAVPGRWTSRVRWELANTFVMQDPRFDGPARVSAMPNADFRTLSVDDWLRTAGLGGAKAATFVQLDVDRGGAVTGCQIERSSADAALAALACPRLQGRDLFTPGFDRDGNAVADKVRVKIRW